MCSQLSRLNKGRILFAGTYKTREILLLYVSDENCRDKYFNCNVVVQARLCVYDYYKTTCCASCSRLTHRQPIHRGRS